MRFSLSFLVFFLLFTNMSEALEEKRLRDFIVQFNARADKNLDRLPYAIEYDYEDIASYFVSRGEPVTQYTMNIPIDWNKVNYSKYYAGSSDQYFKHPLITAIRKGYNELAKDMIQMGVNPSKSVEHKTVMRKRAGSNEYNDLVNIDQKTALYVYITEGNPDLSLLTALLLKSDPQDLDNLSYGGRGDDYERRIFSTSPLSVAIEFGRLEDAILLMESRAEINKLVYTEGVSGYVSALFFAVKKHDKEAVMLLVEFGADPLLKIHSSTSFYTSTALDIAMQLGYQDLVDILLAAACK